MDRTVGIRELKQNASEVVAQVERGDVVTVTNRGRAVARLVPIETDDYAALIASGKVIPASRSLVDVPPARAAEPGQPTLSEILAEMRDDERY